MQLCKLSDQVRHGILVQVLGATAGILYNLCRRLEGISPAA